MRKNNIVSKILTDYFDPNLDLRIQAFNLLGCAGIAAGIIAALSAILTGVSAVNAAINLLASVLAFFLLWFARRTNRYRACYIFTVVVIFIIAFPIMFFTSGGYHSGMPSFFVFALVFTAMMLSGWGRLIAIAVEFVIYVGACLIAWLRPDTVIFFATEQDFVIDAIIGIVVSGALLLLVILLYMRIYNNRQERLEELDKLKTEFLGNAAHELKTPLTVISGYAQKSRKRVSGIPQMKTVENYMSLIGSEADRLALMISQILDVTRIEEGRMAMNIRPASVMEIVQDTVATYYPVFSKNNNTLDMSGVPDLPTVLCDPQRIMQVLVNLISNAARFTRDARITLSAGERADFVNITVADTGEGIAPELLLMVFDRFKSLGGAETGTGLGLYICKHIVEAHGGEISVVSEVDKGTAVTFSLPVQG